MFGPKWRSCHTHGCLFCFPGLGEAMDMASKESISIPFGTGICGHVAETKETIYIKDAYNVSYFKTINLVST